MPPTLLDDTLLLLLDRRSGRLPLNREAVTNALVGALVLDLLTREVAVHGDDAQARGLGELVAVEGRSTGDTELDAALQSLSARPLRVGRLLTLNRRGLRVRVGARLEAAGLVATRPGRLGRRLVPAGTERELRLRDQVTRSAREGLPASPHAADLLLVTASQGLAHVAASVRRREMHPEAGRLTGPDWLRHVMAGGPDGGGDSVALG